MDIEDKEIKMLKKQNIIFLIILVIISVMVSADVKDYYSYSFDIQMGNCGGSCPAVSGVPHPGIADRNDSNSCTGGAKYFCDCGWDGGGCTYNDNNVTIVFKAPVTIEADSISISVNDCKDKNWDTYQIFSLSGDSLVPITNLMIGQDIYCNDTTEIQQLHHDAFTAYAIQFYAKTNNTDSGIFIQEIYFGDEDPTVTECSFPSIFCDGFNYEIPVSTRGWTVYDESYAINDTFIPKDDKLSFQLADNYFLAQHSTDKFPVNYLSSSDTVITEDIYAPAMSVEFKLTVYNSSTACHAYEAKSHASTEVYNLIFCPNESIYHLSNDADTYYPVCESCFHNGTEHKVKVNTFFKDSDAYGFNSSNVISYSALFIDGSMEAANIPFIDNSSIELGIYGHIQDYGVNSTVDDYYVMVGLDRFVDISKIYYTDYFDNLTSSSFTPGGTGQDMAVAVASIWSSMGLKSTTSRVIAGLGLMFILAIGIYGLSLGSHHPISASVIMIIEFFFMLLLTFIKLLPIWIPFVVVLLAVGIGALSIKMGTSQ